jgi:hypothetical protein
MTEFCGKTYSKLIHNQHEGLPVALKIFLDFPVLPFILGIEARIT